MKILLIILFSFVAQSGFAAPEMMTIAVNTKDLKQLTCTTSLDRGTSEFLNRLQSSYSIAFSSLEGIVYELKISQNMFGIFTGKLFSKTTSQLYDNLPAYVCVDTWTRNYYAMFYADRKSPIGIYKYEGFVLIPMNIKPSTNTQTYVNLRTGVFTPIVMRIDQALRR